MNVIAQFRTKVNQSFLLFSFRPFDLSTAEGRANERYRRIVLTALAAGAARGINIITSLITVPLTLNYLGVERYGLWMTVSSFTILLSFADLGLGNGLLNSISDANGRGNRESALHYVSSAFVMLCTVACILGFILMTIYPFVNWGKIFNVKSSIAISESAPTLLVFIVCFLLNLPLSIIQRVQLGYQQGYANGLWQAGGSFATLIVILVVIYLQGGLPWLVLAFVGTPVLVLGIQGIAVFGYEYPWLFPSWKHVSRSTVYSLFRLGILFFILQAAVALAYATDNIILTQLLGPEAVAQYAVAARLYSIPASILVMLFMPLWPAYGEAVVRGDTAWVKRTLLRSLALVLLVAGVPCIALVIWGQNIIKVWAGSTVTPSANLLVALAAWTVISALGNAVAMFLNGANIIKFQVVCASLMAVTAVLIKTFLTPRLGISGVVWGTLIAYIPLVAIPMCIYIPHILLRLDNSQGIIDHLPATDLISSD